MSQLQAEIPHPLRDHLPALLPPGRVRAPAVRVLFEILICQRRLEGSTMQVEFDHISSSEGLLRQVREEEFIDDARSPDANRVLLLACWMGGHHQAAGHSLRSHWHSRAVIEAAHHLTLWTLLQLIWWEMETGLDKRMIKRGVLLAASHEGEAFQIGEDSPRAVLAVEPKQGAFRQELVRREVTRDGSQRLSQFLPVPPVADGAPNEPSHGSCGLD